MKSMLNGKTAEEILKCMKNIEIVDCIMIFDLENNKTISIIRKVGLPPRNQCTTFSILCVFAAHYC